MADTTGAAESQADEATQPQAGAESPPQAGGAQTAQAASAAAGTGTGDSDEPLSLGEARKLRKEANDLRKRVSEFEQAQAQADKRDLSELQRAQKRIAELEKSAAESQVRRQDDSLRLAVIEAATKLGFTRPDLAIWKFNHAEVEWSEDGTPKHVERLLRAALEQEPDLGKTRLPDLGGGPRGATPSTQPGMNDLLRAAARGS